MNVIYKSVWQTVLGSALLFTASAHADQVDRVAIPSLEVKERLHSIEQINVTAEKEAQPVQPSNAEISDILEEAAAIDESSQSAEQ